MKRVIFLAALVLVTTIGLKAQTTPSVSDVLENVLTSVVTVSVEKTENTKQILGFRGNASDVAYERILDLSESKGSGSGFVIEYNGTKYVVTNAHVIEEASEKDGSIYIYSINRTKYEARILGGDSFYDIAVLEFVTIPGDEIKPITFSTKEPRIGEQVFAVGNPLGEYPYTVSEGIISAKNRVRDGLTGKFGFLQTTATVIWGNSGGPLVNTKGQVVGINSQIAFAKVGSESLWQPQINFALEGILSNRLVDDIINNNGRVKRAFLGIELTQAYDLNLYSTKVKSGWELRDSLPVLTGIMPGSPAAGVLEGKEGSLLIKVGSVEVRNVEEAMGEFERLKPGEKVKLTLRTNGIDQEFEVPTIPVTITENEEIARFAFKGNEDFSLMVFEDAPYLVFNDEERVSQGGATDRMQGTGRNNRVRGNDISSGSWEIAAAGYDNSDYSSMWRVKSIADIGVALRLTASLGSIDLYIVKKGGSYENMVPKRISFSGKDTDVWLDHLWY